MSERQRMRGYIVRHDTARTDQCILTDRHPAHNHRSRTDRRATADVGSFVPVFLGNGASRTFDVGKRHPWTAKHVIVQGDSIENVDSVLNPHSPTQTNVSTDINVLAKHAVGTDLRPGYHMREMPDLRSFANGFRRIDDSGFMDREVFHRYKKQLISWFYEKTGDPRTAR